ncbi:hypothetical protein FF100_04040 [Methylobacterium terricola]|uniref:Tripartite ATP-independent transporter, DctQ component n=1 Tax=Methylobacterium terricola TaxID=2583531 RepID=A0A5C4LRH4_9HYPH|nr:hypothetical protein [Methylobacterium terricola]TNC16424.1 hypothetical protein FF100_04040 [Methylobacterium terricola]
MATLVSRVEVAWDRYYPILCGLSSSIAFLALGRQGMQYMVDNQWEIANIYGDAFNFFGVLTAFLFTFYTFVVTADRGFIGKMKGTYPYRCLISYTLRALFLAGLVTVASIFLHVAKPAPVHFGPSFYWLAAWVGSVVWAAVSFIRAAHLFSVFANLHT